MFNPFRCLLGITMLSILFFSCGDETYDSSIYYPGVVKIKANKDYPNGMIESFDAFYQDSALESLSRAIMYVHDGEHAFDLNDTVIFKIRKSYFDNILLATDIQKNNFYIGKLEDSGHDYFSSVTPLFGDSSMGEFDHDGIRRDEGKYVFRVENKQATNQNSIGTTQQIVSAIKPYNEDDYASKDQLYQMKHHYYMNLHQADTHREGPFHIRRHIKPPKRFLGVFPQVGNNQLYAVILEDESGEKIGRIVINENNIVNSNMQTYLYIYYNSSISDSALMSEANNFFAAQSIPMGDRDVSQVYDLSRSHDHTLGN